MHGAISQNAIFFMTLTARIYIPVIVLGDPFADGELGGVCEGIDLRLSVLVDPVGESTSVCMGTA